MAKMKRYHYLIDGLTQSAGSVISKGLEAVESIEAVNIDISRGMIEVVSSHTPDANVEMACSLAGAVIRTKLKKKHLR
jgi:hypothetical protein